MCADTATGNYIFTPEKVITGYLSALHVCVWLKINLFVGV